MRSHPLPRPQRSTFLLTSPSPLFYSLHFSCGLWLSFLVLCSETARKRLLRRLLRGATFLRLLSITGVDFGSFFSWRRLRYALFLFLCGPYVFEGCLKYRLFSVDKKKYSRHKRDSLHCVINTSSNIHWSDRSHHASKLANNTDLQRSFYPFFVLNSDIPHFNSKKIVK